MSLSTKEKQKLRKFITELEIIRGRHTELVSVYVPADYDLNKIINHLQQEQGTASNIKDAKTRNNVIDSLEKAVRHLRLFKRTPPNGLAIFAGNIAAQEGKVDIKIWSIEPPEPLRMRLYRCDQTFILDYLKEMLEVKEIYGLIVIDRREAALGLLKGTSITVLDEFTSAVPGKTRAGGQCISPDTFIMKDDGEIIEIKDAHNPLLTISENFNKEQTEETPIIAKWENNKELFRVSTYYPRFEIKSSKDHTFFIRTNNGIKEKPLSKIKKGDYLVLPEKIDLNLKDQKINFQPNIKQNFNIKKINIPNKINSKLAKIFGYYLGDGSYEIDRLTFFEQRKEVAKYYKKLIEDTFKIKVDLRFRKSKNYYQIRVYSKIISQLFKDIFSKKEKTLFGKIPSIILRSSDRSIASFISGFFDAEGYVSGNRVALGINNELLVRQIQFVLLRLGIISSINEYDNRRNPYSNKIRYTLAIDDTESLKKFYNLVGFNSFEKQNKLKKIINNRSNTNRVRQIAVNGKEIARIIRNSGLNTTQFRCPDFFINKKQLNKEIFKKNILNNIKDINLKKRLELFYKSNLIIAKISKIESIGQQKTIDIETKNHNFIANGIIAHNSSQRFERIREGAAKEFFKRIADYANKEFLDKPNLKGLIIGGPGPTKEEFIHYLNNELKKKIIAVQDITYTDEFGLHNLVDKSKDILAKEIIMEEKEIMNKFFDLLAKTPEKVAYGKKEVDQALQLGAIDTLLLSDSLDNNLIESYEEQAEKINSTTQIISTETREGQQLKDLGGIAAILRFPINI
jgi:peptide subunit release factor 1 (eRF1)/intein/homing endonuclease